MTAELKRIARLRDLRAHSERAAQRALAASRMACIEAEREEALATQRFASAADRAFSSDATSSADLAIERAFVRSLAKQLESADTRLHVARAEVTDRLDTIANAHREVERLDRWSDIARDAIRSEGARLERIGDDEIAARRTRI